MSDFDVIIVGGGIAGASLGAEIAAKRRTLIIEAEDHCGYHSTGRSAAFYLESYGGPEVARLSTASGDFLSEWRLRFRCEFLRARRPPHRARRCCPSFRLPLRARIVERAELERMDSRDPARVGGAPCSSRAAPTSTSPASMRHILNRFRRDGGQLRTDARLHRANRRRRDWLVVLEDGSEIIGAETSSTRRGPGPTRSLKPVRPRRSAFPPSAGRWCNCGWADRACATCRWSTTRRALSISRVKATGRCGSARTTRLRAIRAMRRRRKSTSPPRSTGFEEVVDWRVETGRASWAGLRSFAPDRLPVYGFDADAPGFFWCAGRVASASRPRRRRRSWRQRYSSASRLRRWLPRSIRSLLAEAVRR